MDAEKLAMQRRIDNLTERLAIVERERDAFREACDVAYIVMLERKAIQLEMLEEMIKRGLCVENGGLPDE